MSLFMQTIKFGIQNENNAVEKHEVGVIKKDKIKMFVKEGSVVILNDNIYFANGVGHMLHKAMFKDTKYVYVCPQQIYNIKTVSFGDQIILKLDKLGSAVGKFAVVISSFLDLKPDELFLKNFIIDKEITIDDVRKKVKELIDVHIKSEVQNIISEYITDETTDVQLKRYIDEIVNDLIVKSGKTASLLRNIGAIVNDKCISVKLNKLETTEEDEEVIIKKINRR